MRPLQSSPCENTIAPRAPDGGPSSSQYRRTPFTSISGIAPPLAPLGGERNTRPSRGSDRRHRRQRAGVLLAQLVADARRHEQERKRHEQPREAHQVLPQQQADDE